ncbi:hypothetical protein EC973_006416 [Apophysomyces ossiformis]|uniref:PH domain-containing protein n=1 Tax=Apophysomyces ossiformis TaxID=679940 RepID=A0A8H7C0S1_9FUNG|nr:hypothetical protein EC973_006416 [Apophysomyces ossiformis]
MPTAGPVTQSKQETKKHKQKAATEPTVHYNGPFHTLEQLPEEKLAWIKQETSNLGHPLANCTQSVVMHKPHIRSQTFPMLRHPMVKAMKPKAMFYLRVRTFRCSAQVDDQICVSAHAPVEKCGKRCVEANFDEIFLFDVDKPTTAVLTVYAQIRSSGMFNSRTQDKCIGKETFKITMCAQQKQLQRFTINNHAQPNQSNTYQILVVYGTFVSRRAQTLLNKTTLLQDFVTIYVRGRTSPRWDRYWAVLRGVQLELYDFQYRETHPPQYIFPLQSLVRAVYPATDDEAERQIDIGSRGLALEFSEQVLDRRHRLLDDPEFECRMYLLPDSLGKAREWEKAFTYVTTIFHELQQEDEEDTVDHDDEDEGDFSCSSTASDYSEEEEEEEDDDEDEEECRFYESDDSELSRKLAHTVLGNRSKTVPSKFLW